MPSKSREAVRASVGAMKGCADGGIKIPHSRGMSEAGDVTQLYTSAAPVGTGRGAERVDGAVGRGRDAERAARCATCGERPEERRYPSKAALGAAAAAAALFFIFILGVAVGAAAFSPWVGVGSAVAMAAVPSSMSASNRAICKPFDALNLRLLTVCFGENRFLLKLNP